MKIQHSIIVTVLVLILFLITLYFYIQYKSADRTTSGIVSPTISVEE